jgi:hypothetical protein
LYSGCNIVGTSTTVFSKECFKVIIHDIYSTCPLAPVYLSTSNIMF